MVHPRVSRRPSAATVIRPAARRAEPGPEAARERVVTAARRHFLSFGFARCTMDDLAAELGMSKKTLYRHFPSKDALLDELLTRKSAAMLAGFQDILAAPRLSFVERSARFLQHAHVQLSEISLPFLHDLRRFAPAQYARIEEVRAQNVPRMWEQLLNLGIKAGAVRADLDVAFVARLVLITIQSLLQPDNLERLGARPHEVIGRFFNLVFAGLLTRSGLSEHEKHRAAFDRPIPLR